MKELIEICTALKDPRRPTCALATVIHVEGSAYRRPGARMLIGGNGETWGMISGGCLEHDVLSHARRVMRSGVPTIVHYDSTSTEDIIFGTGLGCNGLIDVLIEPVTEDYRRLLIQTVEACQRTRRPGAIATQIDPPSTVDTVQLHAFLVQGVWKGNPGLTQLLSPLNPGLEDSTIQLHAVAKEARRIFVQPLLPPIQLVIFGGWFDVIPLVRLAKEVGFQTIVVDSRQRPASVRLFREADSVMLCSPADALSKIQFDSRTVTVVMNHHFDSDRETLEALSRISTPYVGLLGPRRRREKLLAEVQKSGVEVSATFLASLHGPAGLDIGANTPAKIALSIVAEILARLNDRTGNAIGDHLSPWQIAPNALTYA